MVEHIQVTRRVLDELQELHVEVGNEEKRQNFLHSIGPAWNGFIGVLDASSTFEDMANRCQGDTLRRSQQEGQRSTSSASAGGGEAAVAFNIKVKESQSNEKFSKKKLDLTKIKCFNCQMMGHFARDCTNEHIGRSATKSESAGMAFSVEGSGADSRREWIVDSGTASHMSD
ncbi:unnamed protein product [Phytophthora fragariaefolia]|uniref:Unnamed protein product n=1 Tax=Phytophthora fragariaefolia TaxID=1490495 RepID=A0A9W6TXF8_9STRA|nr:unnamed protein product [Phytophthora fragariaefolia]